MQEMLGGVLPVTETALSPYNLMTILATVIVVAFTATRLAPDDKEVEEIEEKSLSASVKSPKSSD